MNFLQWFGRYARWDTVVWFWLSIVGFGAVWEILGLGKNRTTFTDLVRANAADLGQAQS